MRTFRIPQFKTFEGARDFLDTHSLADLADELEEAKEIDLPRKVISLYP
jgi:hypothetical protein